MATLIVTNKQNLISLWGCAFPSLIHPAHISVIAQKGVYNYFSVGEFQMMSYNLLKV